MKKGDGITNYLLKEKNKKLRRKCHSIGVILADIDYFKRINDNYGHHVEDSILERISHQLKASIRHQDSVARWGGEEFFFLLPETDLYGAVNLAEKLRRKIQALKLNVDGKTLTVIMSFGVSAFNGKEDGVASIDEAVRIADGRLYGAKDFGRNCVFPLEAAD